MKKYIALLILLVTVPFLAGAGNLSDTQIYHDIEVTYSKLNIRDRLTGGKPRSLFEPVSAYISDIDIKISIDLDVTFDVEIVDANKNVVKAIQINPNISSEELIDITDLNSGNYVINFYRTGTDVSYYSEFTIE